MTVFDGALFDNGLFHSAGVSVEREDAPTKGAGKRRVVHKRKVRYHWEQQYREMEQMIRRRK